MFNNHVIWKIEESPYVWGTGELSDYLDKLSLNERRVLAIDCVLATYDLEPGEKEVKFRLGTLILAASYSVDIRCNHDCKSYLLKLRDRLTKNGGVAKLVNAHHRY